jgi:succinylarginine dihydrolase
LPAENTLIVQQSPHAIDSGAFHNDVVAVANLDLLLYHEHAFLHRGAVIEQLSQYFARAGGQLTAIMASDRDVPLADAVKSYLFNSQIVQSPSGERLLIAPIESQEIPSSRMFLESLVNNGVIHQLHYVDVRQSMRNGGGPACLRLRVVLNERGISPYAQRREIHRNAVREAHRLGAPPVSQYIDANGST